MYKRLLPTTVVLAMAATFALAGCSLIGGGGEEEKLDATESPLTEYYEAMYGGYDEDEAAAQQQQVEELVAACMADEGFDYKPVDQSQYTFTSSEDLEDRDTEAWVAEHGYGTFQTPEEIEAMNEQSEQYVDPNQDYVMALSQTEQEAYYEVLYGPGPTDEEQAAMDEDGSYEYNWETAGCQGAAQHEISGDDITQNDEYKPLMDALNSLYEKQQSAPAVVKVNAAWASCMADAGYADFETKQDAMDSVYAESNAYYENGATDEPDAETQAKWRANEIDVALADFKCSDKVDYQKTTLAAQFDLENQFIADHKAELDAMIAAIEQGN